MFYGWSERPSFYNLPDEARWHDSGMDSHVWKYEDVACKTYSEISLHTIKAYQNITNTAANYLLEHPFDISIDSKYSLHISQIVPIDEIISSQNTNGETLITTKSKWIDGPHGADFLYFSPRYVFPQFKLLPRDEAARLVEFYSHCKKNEVIPSILKEAINRISTNLSLQSQWDGIEILDLNYKVRSFREGQIELIITDLCGQLNLLRPFTAG